MTHDEAVAQIRLVDRRCKGPFRTTVTPRDYQRLSDDTKASLATVVPDATGLSGREIYDRLTAAGTEHHPAARAFESVMRTACGYDVNELLAAGPFHGTKDTVPCPGCGQPLSFTRPIFDLAG